MFTPLGLPFEAVPGHHGLHVLRRRQQCLPASTPLDRFAQRNTWPLEQASALRSVGITPRARFAIYTDQLSSEYLYVRCGDVGWCDDVVTARMSL
jgi:hypothetical protein